VELKDLTKSAADGEEGPNMTMTPWPSLAIRQAKWNASLYYYDVIHLV